MKLFLDVDGVLNPYESKGRRGGYDDFAPHTINGYTLYLSPKQGAELAALPVDIVWATTWVASPEGLEEIASIIGLPADLPRIEFDAMRGWVSGWRGCGKHWGIEAFVEGNESFVWCDDMLGSDDHSWANNGHRRPLLVRPADDEGLLPSDIAHVARFVGAVAA